MPRGLKNRPPTIQLLFGAGDVREAVGTAAGQHLVEYSGLLLATSPGWRSEVNVAAGLNARQLTIHASGGAS